MNVQTEALSNFKIYQDGELDKVAYAKTKAAVIGGNVLDGISAYGEQVGNAFSNLATQIGQSLSTSMFDMLHGTDYHDQLVSQWETEARTEFIGKVGLL